MEKLRVVGAVGWIAGLLLAAPGVAAAQDTPPPAEGGEAQTSSEEIPPETPVADPESDMPSEPIPGEPSGTVDDEESVIEEEAAARDNVLAQGPPVRFGIGVRGRAIFMPEGIIELFVEDAPSGLSTAGFGIEVIRRKADFDIVFALEYENIETDEGLYLEKGDDPGVPGQEPDFVEFDNFSFLGIDVSFIWHTPLHEKFALRYGAGVGLGFVLGDLFQTDTMCMSSDIGTCTQIQNVGRVKNEDIPPVVPIVNLLFGARIKVAEEFSINAEVGFRNLFYGGLGANYFF